MIPTTQGAIRFADLVFSTPDKHGTIRARATFPNCYGASVIRGPCSYGGDEGLYEVGVFRDGYLCYDTPITDDVLGHLTEGDVTDLLRRIASLPGVA